MASGGVSAPCALHCIVELEDHLLRSIGAIPLLVLAADNRELVQDVRHRIARLLQRHPIHEHPSPLAGNVDKPLDNVTVGNLKRRVKIQKVFIDLPAEAIRMLDTPEWCQLTPEVLDLASAQSESARREDGCELLRRVHAIRVRELLAGLGQRIPG